MKMIVIDLQKDALDNQISTLDLLRKAYLVARKLHLKDFEEWAEHELNGYSKADTLPPYRKIKGEVIALNITHGGTLPVTLPNDDFVDLICVRDTYDSIAHLKNIYDTTSNNFINIPLAESINQTLSKMSNYPTKFALSVSTSQLYNIIETTRNHLLKWAITLEENGILGEDMQFTDTERTIATTSTIYNYTNINIFMRDVKDTQIQQDSTDSIQEMDN
jgi:hypothetical protein